MKQMKGIDWLRCCTSSRAVSDDVRESIDWKVYNLLGSCVYASKEQNFLSNKTKLIDISTQPSGLYYLQLTTSFGSKTVKLVKQ